MVREALIHGDLTDHAFHTMEVNTENCLPCHTLAEGDFDYNGVQTDCQSKLDQVGTLMGYTDWADLLETLNDDNLLWTPEQRGAVYGPVFVSNSGDLCVHNKTYAFSLLDNAITFLTPVP